MAEIDICSGTVSEIVPTFAETHTHAASITGIESSSDITPTFEEAAAVAPVTLPQLVLDSELFTDTYDTHTVLSEGDIVKAVGKDFIFDNTGGSGTGSVVSGSSGVDIYDEGILVHTGATELNLIGAGLLAATAGGVRANITLSRVENISFINQTVISIPTVTAYPVFVVYIQNGGRLQSLFDSSMFDASLYDQVTPLSITSGTTVPNSCAPCVQTGISVESVFDSSLFDEQLYDQLTITPTAESPTFSAVYDAATDVLTITLGAAGSGVVSLSY